MVTRKGKKVGRPAGTGVRQHLEALAKGWQERALNAEQKLAEHTLAHNAQHLELQREVAEAQKIARKTTAQLHTMHDILQGALRVVMNN